ncbi:glycosyltransferase [Providencia stuartii]|uniref:glycosyltransferase n=1 Tax=Providencia stuartii TaxID=588 RepID=UPI0034E3ADA0
MRTIKTISIIIPIYNNVELIDIATTSINKQIIPNDIELEIILIDDGSKNLNKELILNTLSKKENIVNKTHLLINNVNIGTVKTLNRAINHSKGDIIIPLSADDEFYDNHSISHIINYFSTHPDCLLVTGLRVPIINNKETPSLPEKKHYPLFNKIEKLKKHLILSENIISGASTYYHKDIFNKLGGFDENYILLEDYPFYLKALDHKIPIHLIEKKVIKYGTNGISSGKVINIKLKNDLEKALKYAYSIGDLGIMDKRKFYFNRILNKKKKIICSIFYPDQVVLLLLRKIKRYV